MRHNENEIKMDITRQNQVNTEADLFVVSNGVFTLPDYDYYAITNTDGCTKKVTMKFFLNSLNSRKVIITEA